MIKHRNNEEKDNLWLPVWASVFLKVSNASPCWAGELSFVLLAATGRICGVVVCRGVEEEGGLLEARDY